MALLEIRITSLPDKTPSGSSMQWASVFDLVMNVGLVTDLFVRYNHGCVHNGKQELSLPVHRLELVEYLSDRRAMRSKLSCIRQSQGQHLRTRTGSRCGRVDSRCPEEMPTIMHA